MALSFPRRTTIEAVDLLTNWTHAEIDRFLLRFDLSDVAPSGKMGPSKDKRATMVAEYLLANPEEENEYGENLSEEVVRELINSALERLTNRGGFDADEFRRRHLRLAAQLERDGFSIEGGELRRALPEELDLPEAEDELRSLLTHYEFHTPKGHLDQAIDAHTRGDWAASNSQLRAFVEGLLNDIADRLAGKETGGSVPRVGHHRRQWLAAGLETPFYGQDLNEWSNDGKGFIESFWRRLHPAGSHAGLSDEDDCTFRLHLVLIVARLLLRRFDQRVS